MEKNEVITLEDRGFIQLTGSETKEFLQNIVTNNIEKVTDVIKKYGGKYLARGGDHQVVEGEDNFPRIIIIKFPTYEKALEWYHSDEYKPVKDIRLQNSEGSNIIVKGV